MRKSEGRMINYLYTLCNIYNAKVALDPVLVAAGRYLYCLQYGPNCPTFCMHVRSHCNAVGPAWHVVDSYSDNSRTCPPFYFCKHKSETQILYVFTQVETSHFAL